MSGNQNNRRDGHQSHTQYSNTENSYTQDYYQQFSHPCQPGYGQCYQRRQETRGYGYRQQCSQNYDPVMALSKSLSYLLRHGAAKQKLKLLPGGFLYVADILKMQQFCNATEDLIIYVVENNDKNRFALKMNPDNHRLMIRANQGHTMQVESLELTPITDANEIPIVIHGTYLSSWELIKNEGLKRFDRNHIHFAAGQPGEDGVISGMRSSCQVMIYINAEKALKAGIPFFLSANNVILSPGDVDGVIGPCFFNGAVTRRPFSKLEFDPDVDFKSINQHKVSQPKREKSKKSQKTHARGEEECAKTDIKKHEKSDAHVGNTSTSKQESSSTDTNDDREGSQPKREKGRKSQKTHACDKDHDTGVSPSKKGNIEKDEKSNARGDNTSTSRQKSSSTVCKSDFKSDGADVSPSSKVQSKKETKPSTASGKELTKKKQSSEKQKDTFKPVKIGEFSLPDWTMNDAKAEIPQQNDSPRADNKEADKKNKNKTKKKQEDYKVDEKKESREKESSKSKSENQNMEELSINKEDESDIHQEGAEANLSGDVSNDDKPSKMKKKKKKNHQSGSSPN